MFRTGKRKYILFTVFVVILLLVLSLFSNPVEKEKGSEVTVVLDSVTSKGNYSIVYNHDTGQTVLAKDGVEVKILSNFYQEIEGVLQLPEVTNTEDITLKESVTENAWESDLVSSVSYINKLEEEGFTIKQRIGTSHYVDLVLTKEDSVKRVIILRNLILVSDMESDSKLPDVEEVIKKYENAGGSQ